MGAKMSSAGKTTHAVILLLDQARDLGYTITRTTLAKLLYFADLAAVKAGTEPVSGLQWRWLHHGPYDNALLRLENELTERKIIFVRPYYAGWQLALDPTTCGDDLTSDDLDDEQVSILNDVVREMGPLAAVSIRDLSYQTEPMIDAQARGRETVLNLDLVRPVPRISRAVAEARALLSEQGRPAGEPGAQQEVADELARLAEARRQATSTILGDD